jgi:hypothetical protein
MRHFHKIRCFKFIEITDTMHRYRHLRSKLHKLGRDGLKDERRGNKTTLLTYIRMNVDIDDKVLIRQLLESAEKIVKDRKESLDAAPNPEPDLPSSE